jgi:hypothetical protein
MAKNIIIVLLILVIIPIIYQIFFNNPPLNTKEFTIKGRKFNLEIAKTIPQQSKGLMDRTNLCSNCGMIFIFDFEMPQAFWMKNTLIPLDMIFLDKNSQVINIVTATPEPNVSDLQLKKYLSTAPAKYVIELNAGVSSNLGLKSGDTIDLSIL